MAQGTVLSIAIGIGETYCKLAFCKLHDFERNPSNIHALTWSNANRDVESIPVSTTVLLNPDKSFHSFGYEAEKDYADMTENDQSSYYYFRNLQNLKKTNRNAKIKDETGKMLPVFDVFVHLIQFMKDNILRQRGITEIPHDWMMFTLTIPARWGNNAKPCIREAAEKTGIPRNNLIVCLDPVVAALCCYPETHDQISSFYKAIMSGAPYIVVDLGDRTGDISYHQHNGFLRKLLPTDGRALAGNSVNEKYLKFLGQVFGEKRLLELKNEYPEEYMDTIREFERKLRFGLSKGPGDITLQNWFYNEEAISKGRTVEGVKLFRNKIRFGKEQIGLLLEQTLTAIEAGIEGILSGNRLESDHILMVGEFSECELVTSAIRKRFPQKNVIVPRDPSPAIIKGAALFIFLSKTMNMRARCTYGVQHCPEFNKTRHPLDKLVVINGVIRSKDVFFTYIERDEKVPENRRISHVCTLFTTSSDTVECTVYASCQRDPKFTDNQDCTVLGVLQTPFTGDGGVAEMKIEQTLIFGETCLTLQAENMATGQVCETQMEYM